MLRSKEEVVLFRAEAQISVKGDNVPNPIQYFEEGNFPPYVMEAIRRQGFSQPTPIQAQGWPIALSGKDLVAIAQTGSGKTLGVRIQIFKEFENLSVYIFFFIIEREKM